MQIYNLTNHDVVITSAVGKYGLPPHIRRFDFPIPKAMLSDVGFVDKVELFVPLGSCQGFDWNDIVIVTPEMFASFTFECEVWIASGHDGRQYTRLCRVHVVDDPALTKEELSFDEANTIIAKALSDTTSAHNLSSDAVTMLKHKLRDGSDGKLLQHTIQLAENPDQLRKLIVEGLRELGIALH